MGYSARYHAASLAAVFLALAVGILIGAGLGSNVLNDTESSLRKSLESDLSDARSQSDDLRAELGRQQDFARSAYPVLVGGRLAGQRVGVIALGDISGALSDDIDEGLNPTGGKLAEVSVVRTPPDVTALASELKGSDFGAIANDPKRLEELGKQIGQQLARGGGPLVNRTGDVLLSRSSGEARSLDQVILVRTVPGDLNQQEKTQQTALESGIVEGVRRSGLRAVAVERTDAEFSSVPFFKDRDLPTVDNVESVPGQVAMIFALLGANGDFGAKGTADKLLPELLVPAK